MRFKFLLLPVVLVVATTPGLCAANSPVMGQLDSWALAAESRSMLTPAEAILKAQLSQDRAYDSNSSSDEFHWSGRVSQGRAIEVKGINGHIQASATSGGEIDVVADKHGRRNDPREVRIQVIEHSDGVTICAVYPTGDSSRPNVCEPGPASHMHVQNNDVTVDFTVHVPSGVRFIGRTINGGVEAESINSDVEAHTINGSVRISASGHAQATTVNGSITASLGNAQWTGLAEFKTVNGGINLTLPGDVNTDLEAETLNGSISTDFPLTVQGRIDRRHISGSIGNSGSRQLFLKTVNGSVHLRRAG